MIIQNGRSLWAIAAYFNPAGYRTRRENYRIFREQLDVPLLTVEYYLDEPQLNAEDADKLIQISGHNLLWQKERLLNIALDHLPDECRYVAWLDCDIVFAENSWSREAERLLENYRLIQLFQEATLLPPAVNGSPDYTAVDKRRISFVRYLDQPEVDPAVFSECGLSQKYDYCPGYAWAARREILERCGFYDAMIIGGADKAMTGAALGYFEETARAFRFSRQQSQHYYQWARGFHAAVERSIGYARQSLYHLWHGDLQHRKYRQRFFDLSEWRFDPARDIEIDPQSRCWKWNTTKSGLRTYTERYFFSRCEDG